MKKIGLIGGMSWESSALYYTLINQFVREELGGLHSARCIMSSVDFAEIARMQADGDWSAAGRTLAVEARNLEAAGAEFLVLCTNTMHKVAESIQAAVSIPLLHIGHATADAVRAAGVTAVGLLGTRFTMQEAFYQETLARYGLTVLVPTPGEQAKVNRIIYDELVLGRITEESRKEYRVIIAGLARRGAQGVILGCTEIELLVHDGDSPLPLFPTTRIHANAAVKMALSEIVGEHPLSAR